MHDHEASSFVCFFLCRAIEKLKVDLGFESYSLSQTTLEQVFLHHARSDVSASPAAAQPTVRSLHSIDN